MIDNQIEISINLKRKNHDNGMTLKEYADGVIEGNLPILTCDEYIKQFGALETEARQVLKWGRANNLTIVENDLSMILSMALIKYQGTFRQFENLFNIGLRIESSDVRTYYTHDGDITIPEEIKDVVVSVFGLDNSCILTHQSLEGSINEINPMSISPSANISNPTPLDIALAYKAPRTQGSNSQQGRGAVVALIELGGGWTTQNLSSSFDRLGLIYPSNITNISIFNRVSNTPSDDSLSQVLMYDLFLLGAIVPRATILIYYNRNQEWVFAETINYILFDPNRTRASVINISWGFDILYVNYHPEVLLAAESALQSAVILGVTVVASSGVTGTRAPVSQLSGAFGASYPGSSPYVLSCGATEVTIDTAYNIVNEVVWNTNSGGSSGGGDCTIFTTPSWQQGFTTKTYPDVVISPLVGRGFPDIAAMASGYTFNYGPSNTLITRGGNSAPLISGLIAKINQMTGQRVGFLNPFLYANDATHVPTYPVVRDVSSGNNYYSGTEGYSATSGWDACTGLGSMYAGRVYRLKHIGETYPRGNNGTRPIVGQAYPRITTGVRY